MVFRRLPQGSRDQIALSDVATLFGGTGSGNFNPGTGPDAGKYVQAELGGYLQGGRIPVTDFNGGVPTSVYAGSNYGMDKLHGASTILGIATQTIGLGTVYPFGGCAGAGYENATFQVTYNSGITLTTTAWSADYGYYPGSYSYSIGSYAQMIAGGQMPGIPSFSAGRDTPSFLINIDVYPNWIAEGRSSKWYLRIRRDCKGGGLGWPETVYNSPLTVY
jgi:hypothetical protein